MNDWLNKRGRIYWYDQYALNEQETAFSKYDPDRITEELVDTGVDVVAVYATNQFSVAYYPSDILPMHPNLQGRDYFGEVCSRLQANGKKIIAYINWLESRHPEWAFIPMSHMHDAEEYRKSITYPLANWADPNDPERRVENMPGGTWRTSCINSPRQEQVLAVTREILEKYKPEMFHLDMLIQSDVCVCEYCMPTLAKICKTDQVTPELIKANWSEFIKWRTDSSASLIRDIKAILDEYGVLHASNAMAPEFIPAHWGQDEGWIPSLDVFLSECFDAFLVPGLDLNSTSIGVKFQHATGLPSWILRTAHPSQYAHTPLSEAQWKLYASACKANGCKVFGPCGVTANADTTTRKLTHDSIKNGFSFFMQDADLDENAVSDAKTAVVFSWATRRYTKGPEDMDWMGEFNGWGRLLMEEHVPFDVVIAEYCKTKESLAKYDLLVMPDIKCLSEEFCKLISEYVKAGGKVIATGETSLKDIDGSKLADYRLGDVFGASWTGSSNKLFAVERPIEPEPVAGVFQEISSTAKVLSRRVDTDPAGSLVGGSDPTPVKMSDYPAATINEFGSGQALYVACQLGWYFEKYGDEQLGKWMAELVGEVVPARQLDVRAPRTVEVTCWKQSDLNRTIIHLANRTVPWTLPTNNRQISEIVPVHNVEISMDSPFVNPKVSCRGAEICSRLVDGRLEICLDKLDAYAAVVIEES